MNWYLFSRKIEKIQMLIFNYMESSEPKILALPTCLHGFIEDVDSSCTDIIGCIDGSRSSGWG